jgi:hypothetical protein
MWVSKTAWIALDVVGRWLVQLFNYIYTLADFSYSFWKAVSIYTACRNKVHALVVNRHFAAMQIR